MEQVLAPDQFRLCLVGEPMLSSSAKLDLDEPSPEMLFLRC